MLGLRRRVYAGALQDCGPLAGAARPCDAAELAEKAGVQADPLRCFLRAGASLDFLAPDGEGRYRLTPIGEMLREVFPDSAHHTAVSIGRWQRDAWRLDALEAAFIAAYDFTPFRIVMDVGGGNGKLLSAVLAASPHLKGILLDLPGHAGGCRTWRVWSDISCASPRVRPLSVFPDRAGLILMKRVIYDWEGLEAVRILSHARAALEPRGRVVVLDAVIQEDDAPDPVKLLDLHMMLLPGDASGHARNSRPCSRGWATAGRTAPDPARPGGDRGLGSLSPGSRARDATAGVSVCD